MRFSFLTAETPFARWFFSHFWRLLLVVISAGQWVSLVWVALMLSDVQLPLWLHVAGIAGLYAVNRSIVIRRRAPTPRGSGWVMRVYSAWAFTALFCFVFFVAAAATWGLARGLIGALTANAGTVGGPEVMESGVDGAFHWFVSLGMSAIGLLFAYGYVFGQRELVVTRIRVPHRDRKVAAPPVRIVQISDLHVGQNLTAEDLRRFVARVNALEPDLICITGDIADSAATDCDQFFPVLAELHAHNGVCVILGNHDHMAGAAKVAAALRRWTKFHVLRDEAITLAVQGSPLHVIGLDDRGRDWARGRVSDVALGALLAAAPRGLPIVVPPIDPIPSPKRRPPGSRSCCRATRMAANWRCHGSVAGAATWLSSSPSSTAVCTNGTGASSTSTVVSVLPPNRYGSSARGRSRSLNWRPEARHASRLALPMNRASPACRSVSSIGVAPAATSPA